MDEITPFSETKTVVETLDVYDEWRFVLDKSVVLDKDFSIVSLASHKLWGPYKFGKPFVFEENDGRGSFVTLQQERTFLASKTSGPGVLP